VAPEDRTFFDLYILVDSLKAAVRANAENGSKVRKADLDGARSEGPLSAHLTRATPPNTSGHTLATQPFKALKIVPTKEKSITVSALANAVLLA